jgi:MoxR-like ATPase
MEEQNANIDIRAINEKIEKESAFIDLLTAEMNKVIVGQNQMIDRLLIGLLGNGHILIGRCAWFGKNVGH